jgi:hypothetical protein
MSTPSRDEFVLPFLGIKFQECSTPEEIAASLIRLQFPGHGRCAILFSKAELAHAAVSIDPRGIGVAEIATFKLLVTILENLQNAGDTEVGIDLAFGEPGRPTGRFYAIASMLVSCRFWSHIEEEGEGT